MMIIIEIATWTRTNFTIAKLLKNDLGEKQLV